MSKEYIFRKMYVEQFIMNLAHTYKKTALYGAGKHTEWLLQALKNKSLIRAVSFIIDDKRKGQFEGISIGPWEELPEDVEAVLVSSDSNESLLKEKAAERTDLPVLTLYADAGQGPFEPEPKPAGKELFDEVNLAYNYLQTVVEKPLMIDVGAHFGTALKKFANCGWKVHAFEPDDNNRKVLLDRFGSYTNVVVNPHAVTEESQNDLPFFASNVSTGISGLSSFDPSHVQSQTVSSISLTEYCENHSINKVDLLKIDTEGFDLFVLKGFNWNYLKPKVIVCEFEDKKTIPLGYNFHDLCGYLQNKGYTIHVSEWFPIVRYGVSGNWRCFQKYPCELQDCKAWGNLIAVDSSLTGFDPNALRL